MKFREAIIIGVLFVIIVVLILLLAMSWADRGRLSRDVTKLQSDSLTKSRLADSSYQVQMRAIELSANELRFAAAKNDSLLQEAIELARSVKNVKETVILQKSNYYKDTTISQIVSTDTIITDSVIYIYPTYSKSFSDKFLSYMFIAGKDTSSAEIKTFDQIEYVSYSKKEKWWKAPTTHIQVRSLSPYSTIDDLEHISIQPKRNPLSVGISAGYGVVFQKIPTFAPYVGISLNYKLIDLTWPKKSTKIRQDSKQ